MYLPTRFSGDCCDGDCRCCDDVSLHCGKTSYVLQRPQLRCRFTFGVFVIMIFSLLALIRTLTDVIPNIAIRIISAERGGLQGEGEITDAFPTRATLRKPAPPLERTRSVERARSTTLPNRLTAYDLILGCLDGIGHVHAPAALYGHRQRHTPLYHRLWCRASTAKHDPAVRRC